MKKKFPIGLFLLICWIILVSTSVFIYLAYLQPTKLGTTISSALKEKTNLEFNIESVALSFAPSPTLTANSIIFYDTTLPVQISIKNAKGELSWRSLFLLKPVVKRLTVSDIDVKLTLPKLEEKQEQNSEKQPQVSINEISQKAADKLFNRLQDFSIPHYFSSLELTINRANAQIIDPNHSLTYLFHNFNAVLKTPQIIDGYANLNLDELEIFYEDYLLFHLGQTKINAADVSYNPRTYSGNLSFETNLQVSSLNHFYDTPIEKAYDYFPMPEPSFIRLTTNFDIKIRQKTIKLAGELYNKTILPMNGYATPVELKIPFTLTSLPEKSLPGSLNFPHEDKSLEPYKKTFLQENKLSDYALDLAGFYVNEIDIENAVIKADTDALTFKGALTGVYPFNPLIFGKVHVDNFSLPRWIGPTREMNAGLYNALDKIKADIDVFCTLKGVFSPKLEAKVLDYTVRGKSVTANFLKPDICFDLVMDSEKNSPIDLNPLFPEINGKDSNKVKLPPAAVVITKTNQTPKKSSISVAYHINVNVPQQAHIWKLDCAKVNVLVAPNKNNDPTIKVDVDNLYTGKANALVTLYEKQKHEISAQAQNILIEAPLRNIVGYTICTGHADAAVTLRLQGSNLEQILNSLEIKGKINLLDGNLHSKDRLLTAFSKLYADIDLKIIPFKVNKKLPETFALNGLWQLDGDFPEYSAKVYSKNSSINFSTSSGQPLFRTPQATDIFLKEKASKETILNGNGKLGFHLNDNKLILENYKGALRNSKLIANITFEQKNKPNYTGDLYFQHFNLGDYIKNEKKTNTAENAENTAAVSQNKAKEDKPLPLDFIYDNDVNLSIKADKLTFYDITTNNFTGNIKIKDHKISINNLKSNLKNGFVQALLEGSVKKLEHVYQMQTQFKMKGTSLDMLSITKMRKQDTLMSGTGDIAIQGTAMVSKTSDIFKTMNADWSMQFNNGCFQSLKDHAAMLEETKEKQTKNSSPEYTGKTNYTALLASGTITNGIARTKNITLKGTGLSVVGEGEINLVTDTINAFVHATYLGIPEIPITITGSIDDPKYEVKVMTAVSKTIGNIGIGILRVFSSVISQPFRLIMPSN